MAYVDFLGQIHQGTKRNYLERVISHDKAASAQVACKYDFDYWDGDRRYGFGGYYYDGRWSAVAQAMIKYYGLKGRARVLDIGCGKGFLLYELAQLLPEAEIYGLDISEYAIKNAKEEVRDSLTVGSAAAEFPWEDNSFDFVYSVNTLHNLFNYELERALREIERVKRDAAHITIESYRNEREKTNLLYWQLTCRAFLTPQEWEWAFDNAQYTGDYGCIYFE